jgi:hypothetical protein
MSPALNKLRRVIKAASRCRLALPLSRFQQDDLVRQALGRGVELKGYSAQVEQELKEVRLCLSVCLSQGV